MHFCICIVFYTLYSMHWRHCILFNFNVCFLPIFIFCALYSIPLLHCILGNALYSMNCTLCISFNEFYSSMQFNKSIVFCAVKFLHILVYELNFICIIDIVFYALNSMHCILQGVPENFGHFVF